MRVANQYPIAELTPVPSVDPILDAAMSADYLRRRRYIRFKIKPRPPPRFLYKFRELRRAEIDEVGHSAIAQESIARLRALLVDCVLRLSSPAEFNDPFDMKARWIIDGSMTERKTHYTAILKRARPRKSIEERARGLTKLMQSSGDELSSMLGRSFEEQRRTFGVCCFTAGDPRNVLMWSHYSRQHAGLCLQFESARDLLVLARAVSVDYVDEYPVINWIKNDRADIGITLTRKHTRWQYECEHRILANYQAAKYIPFIPTALTGLIFGCMAGDDTRRVVKDLLSERGSRGLPPIKLYRAERNDFRYELDIWRE
jgi:hypothetical protein